LTPITEIPDLRGRKLGPYQVVERLGAGGMGIVYRARDSRLERDVSLKVLHSGSLADPSRRRQFRREALALSRLNHPHIAMIFDIGSEEGLDFLVMELIEGVNLADLLSRGPLDEPSVVRLGSELAQGLAAAHREGVLHRDIKPGNLRVTREGYLKILDFGISTIAPLSDATVTAESLSERQQMIGTLPYMAPEQLRGEAATPAADIHAAGAVLYEMATGRRAFPQTEVPHLIAAILSETPDFGTAAGREVSPALGAVIRGCLAKQPAERWPSADALALRLRRLESGATPETDRSEGALLHGRAMDRSSRAHRWWSVPLVTAAALSVVLGIGGVRDHRAPVTEAPVATLAVLPFENRTGHPDQGYLADGITDELASRISSARSVRVISRASVLEFQRRGLPLGELARALGARTAVRGSVYRAGESLRVSIELTDLPSSGRLFSREYSGSAARVLEIENQLARDILERVRAPLTAEERQGLAASPRVTPAAHEAYLRGRFLFNAYTAESGRKAIEEFQRALALDPSYAPAYVGLASAYFSLSSASIPADEAMPRARAAARRALELDSTLAGAHVALAYVSAFYECNWREAEEEFRQAISMDPGEATAHQFYAQLLVMNGRFREATSEIERAQALDPLSSYISGMALWPLFLGRRYEASIQAADHLLALDPNNANALHVRGQALAMRGQVDPALLSLQNAYEIWHTPTSLGWKAFALARAGRRAEALQVLGHLRSLSDSAYVQPYVFATVFSGLAMRDSAFTSLEASIRAHSEEVLAVKVDPAMDPLRSDARFESVLRRLGFGAGPARTSSRIHA
jgi:TolB-like protein/predicted Zn-dependent protease